MEGVILCFFLAMEGVTLCSIQYGRGDLMFFLAMEGVRLGRGDTMQCTMLSSGLVYINSYIRCTLKA
jgi:hypothetical protein